ncbi:tetraacyldisaccharide 4'-kinase [Enterovirga rhinocerotis]|uniref:Tetraacyldisaccharide 4'-kinase n=1 Tax=Enterovirga rhinocerotis TaxID=1339210 RepID=A0A4R7C663_9HYPH|nr:tetraacyldisaccharide 4'-kinase [Enterovirga rhinocerotis]TDR93888.1 lipid-A-disaccharide kinase [Enterovirga rhinocerotis]
MKAPGFWWRPPGLASAALAPAAAIYGLVAGRRMAKPGVTPPVPVVCIGNVTVGGSGKTPTALAIAALLRDAGRRPSFLTRGYGGSLAGPVQVDPARHGSAEAGDEPLLLAQGAPSIVSRDRPAGAALAASLGADVIVMDDGLQNPSLAKTLSFAVFDGAVGIGNGCVLPAGPLRAPLGAQWPRIDAAIVIGAGEAGDRVAEDAASRAIPVFRARLRPDPDVADRLAGRRALAFAGIGRPAKFFETCRELGLLVEAERAFPDHHPYRAVEIAALLDEAERAGLVPVTTQKDAVRLAGLRGGEPRLGLIQTVPITCAFDEADDVRRLLSDRIG